MEDYSRLLCSALLLLLIKQNQSSPVPKYTPASIIESNQQDNNIQFQDFGSVIAFDDVENRLAPLPPQRKFAPKLFDGNIEEGGKQMYQDKILFSDAYSANHGYIRRFPPANSQGQGILNLRSLYPDAILLKSNSEQESTAPKDFQLENDMPSTTMDVTTPMEIPGISDRTSQDKESVTEESQHFVRPEVLEQWITKNNNKTKQGNPPDGDDTNKITFLSLFRVPNFEIGSDVPPCPENLRRNHHGDCVRPIRRIRYRIIEEEIRPVLEE